MTRFGSLMLSHPQTRSSLRPARYPGHASGNVFEPSCMRSNLHPYIFGLKVRTRVPRPSIFVRSFSLFTTFYASASCRRVTRCEPTSRQYTAKNHESYYLTRQPETPAIAIHTRGGYLF